MEERVNRRSFLQKAAIGGGGLLIFTAGGVAWRAWDRGSLRKIYEGTAFDPWEDWRNNRFKGPSGLVSAAILASNPHNSQPWLFRVDERRIDLYANMSRGLGSIDPFLREMYIGLGCALENLMVAARGRGYEPRLVLFPSGSKQSLFARVELKPGTVAEVPHYRAIGERHTNRSAYDRERDLAPAVIETFNATESQHCATAPRFGVIAVRNRDDKAQLLEAGRLWQRLHLEATLQGVAMHPLNQMMEMADHDCFEGYISKAEYRLARIVKDSGLQAVFGFRCGYARQPAKPAPRRSVNEVIEGV